MPIPVDCSCGREFKVKDELAGNKIRCPDCRSILEVPETQAEIATAVEIDEDAPALPPEPRVRKPQAPRLPDEYTASRTKATYDSEAKAERSMPKSKKRESSGSWFPAISVNSSIISGLLMMVGAVAWFVAGLAINRIFIYPPIMFVLGIGAIIKGFTGKD